MLDLNPTTCKVNDMFVRETLAKAERYHSLTRNDTVATSKPVAQTVIRLPRISVIRRLVQILPRPA
jgi:hypothetical protein